MRQELGLDKVRATIYQAILTGPATGTVGLSTRTRLPQTQVAAALSALGALTSFAPLEPPAIGNR